MPANAPRAFVFTGLTPRRRYAVSFSGVQPTPRRYGVVQTPSAEACAVSFVAVYGNANLPDTCLPVFEAEVRPSPKKKRRSLLLYIRPLRVLSPAAL